MDIAFYLTTADHSEKIDPIISSINQMVDDHPYDNIILFNNTYNRIDTNKKFPIIHINQAKYFKGYLFLFDIKSAMITKTFPSSKKQFLYIDQIPWTTDEPTPVLFWKSIFDFENIETIAKNEQISDILEICWKKPISTVESINSEELYNVITKI